MDAALCAHFSDAKKIDERANLILDVAKAREIVKLGKKLIE